jgi:REP-associated tyrosine transposase
MADTYTQIHIHIVFSVKYRSGLLHAAWRDELYKYITGIIQSRNHKLLAIGGVSDHIHMLIGLRPNEALSDLMRMVKSDSSKWISGKRYVRGQFNWQSGYGTFAVNYKDIANVVKYILNQELHHARQSFQAEFVELLRQNHVDFKREYLFNAPQ